MKRKCLFPLKRVPKWKKPIAKTCEHICVEPVGDGVVRCMQKGCNILIKRKNVYRDSRPFNIEKHELIKQAVGFWDDEEDDEEE